MVEGAESALLAHGYDLTLYNLVGGRDERRSVFEHFLLRKRVDALIAVSLDLSGEEVGHLLDLGMPVVGVGAPLPGLRTLGVDDTAMGRVATEHLIGLGHRRIALPGGYRAAQTLLADARARPTALFAASSPPLRFELVVRSSTGACPV